MKAETPSRRATDLICIWKGFGWITPTGRSRKRTVFEWVGSNSGKKRRRASDLSCMEDYCDHFKRCKNEGRCPDRSGSLARKYYDAKNVWASFDFSLSPIVIQPTEDVIQSSPHADEFMTCFMTSLLNYGDESTVYCIPSECL